MVGWIVVLPSELTISKEKDKGMINLEHVEFRVPLGCISGGSLNHKHKFEKHQCRSGKMEKMNS